MSLTNYQKGRSKEYRIMEKFRLAGCDIVLRSAGSHSPVDIIAINSTIKKIYFIQSKSKSISKNFKNKLLANYGWLNGMFEIYFGVE